MATIRTRKTRGGEVRYEVQVRLSGADPEVGTFDKLKDAKRWAQEREVAIRERRRFGRSLTSPQTLADALDRFTAEHLSRLSASSLPGRERALRFWRDRLGYRKLAEVSPDLVSKALAELDAGPATKNRYLSALARVLSIAEKEWGWLERNAARGVTRQREPPGRVRFLSESERDRLLSACRSSRTRELYPLVVLALSTGGRFSELTGLRWEEIDFDRRQLTFHRTKNRERRSVPLSPPAIEALTALGPQPSGAIFTGKSYRTAWEAAVERAELEDFRFHDLRHSCASALAMSGASLLEIAEILGHRTLLMVRRYAHLSSPHLSNVMDRMAAKFLTPTSRDDPKASD